MPDTPPAPTTDPIRPTDDEARTLARGLIASARFGALGVIDPETGFPAVTRIALGSGPDGGLWTLVSGSRPMPGRCVPVRGSRFWWASPAQRAIRSPIHG